MKNIILSIIIGIIVIAIILIGLVIYLDNRYSNDYQNQVNNLSIQIQNNKQNQDLINKQNSISEASIRNQININSTKIEEQKQRLDNLSQSCPYSYNLSYDEIDYLSDNLLYRNRWIQEQNMRQWRDRLNGYQY